MPRKQGIVIHIRDLEDNDIPALAALAAKTYTETFGHSFSAEDLAAEIKATRSQDYFRAAMKEDTILLAVDGDRIAGYVQLSDVKINVKGAEVKDGDQAVNAIYIHADYQGQGIGRALMDAAFVHPRFKNASNIFIDVWDKNERALNFYLNYGFKVVGKCEVVTDGEVTGHDLVLARPLRLV